MRTLRLPMRHRSGPTPQNPELVRRELACVTRDGSLAAQIAEREAARRPLPCRICGQEALPHGHYCADCSWFDPPPA